MLTPKTKKKTAIISQHHELHNQPLWKYTESHAGFHQSRCNVHGTSHTKPYTKRKITNKERCAHEIL